MNSGSHFGPGFLPVLRSTLIRWERLRILYNLILIAIVVLPVGGGPVELPELADLPILAVGAVLANLCYLAGPAAESYLAWLPTLFIVSRVRLSEASEERPEVVVSPAPGEKCARSRST